MDSPRGVSVTPPSDTYARGGGVVARRRRRKNSAFSPTYGATKRANVGAITVPDGRSRASGHTQSITINRKDHFADKPDHGEMPKQLAEQVALRYHEKDATLQLRNVYPKSVKVRCPAWSAVRV